MEMNRHAEVIATSGSPGPKDASAVGGKAASLFRLLEIGVRVPPFFVITAQAHRSSRNSRLDADLRTAVLEALTELGGESHAYAVRSSGLAEDSADFSYAGVFETVLDVRGADAIIAAIERCWESHGSATAAAYREGRGVVEDAAMAVVVQRMVAADWAGVSFSADPLTQALSVSVINATRGLGEALVSGEINPEDIKIDNATGRIIERRIPDGAEPLPDHLCREVFEATQRVAIAMGFPQDLEWAAADGTLYLLQSRPITTITGVFHNRALEPWAGSGSPDDPDRVWTRAYADEVWTPPVSPLFYDIQNLTAVLSGRLRDDGDRRPTPPDMFKYYRAAPYMDTIVLERLYAALPPISRRPSLLQMLPTEQRESLRRAPWRWSALLKRTWRFEFRHGSRRGINRNHRFLERAWPEFLIAARRLCDTDLSTLTHDEIDEHIQNVWSLAVSVAPECEVAVLYYAYDIKLLLSGLLERWCGVGEERYAEVSTGLDSSETVRESDAIWQIAAEVRAAGQAAVQRVRTSTWAECRASADSVGLGRATQAFENFLQSHQHRGANYKDPIHPRWGDDPELLWTHVRAFLDADSPRPRDANAASGARRREAQQRSLSEVRGVLAPLKRAVLRRLFRYNEIYAGLRDNHRFYYDYVWTLLRWAYLEIGRRLQVDRRLDDAADIFFLVRTEIDALRRGELGMQTAAERISVRRREWLETKQSPPPKLLRRGYVADAADSRNDASAERLVGVPASAGQARGPARVVYDVSEIAQLRRGDILVTRQTDPGWTPAFARIGGLVLETGGVLAHGASLCREYGLPCVTAVEGATSIIREGAEIVVSGGEGVVEILRTTPAQTAEVS